MIGRQSQRKAIQRLSGASGVFFVKRFFIPGGNLGNTRAISLVVPDKAFWAIFRAVGGGRNFNGTNRTGGSGGSGGAFKRTDMACKPGDTIGGTVQGNNDSDVSVFTSITLNGTVVCSAQSGFSGAQGGNGSLGVGQIGASGGGYNAAGVNGGPAGTVSGGGGANVGGGSGGESNAFDALIFGGAGGDWISNGRQTDGQFPGGGGSLDHYGAPGLAVIDLWSGKP